eukprot:8087399-Pyramimonas_sp.AAC.1
MPVLSPVVHDVLRVAQRRRPSLKIQRRQSGWPMRLVEDAHRALGSHEVAELFERSMGNMASAVANIS